MGNPLLDMSATVKEELLTKYGLKVGNNNINNGNNLVSVNFVVMEVRGSDNELRTRLKGKVR